MLPPVCRLLASGRPPPLRTTRPLLLRGCASSSRPPPLLRVGDVGRSQRTFTEADVTAFAALTRDDNPLHSDDSFASGHAFGSRVVHGMLYASMFSAIIGQRTPGAVYLSQSLSFRQPVFLGDQVTAEVEVRRVGRAGRFIDFSTRMENQRSELVLDGEARVMMPKVES